jgi:hypothetical protein
MGKWTIADIPSQSAEPLSSRAPTVASASQPLRLWPVEAPVTSRLEVLERRGGGLKIAQALRRPGGQPRGNARSHRRATETR